MKDRQDPLIAASQSHQRWLGSDVVSVRVRVVVGGATFRESLSVCSNESLWMRHRLPSHDCRRLLSDIRLTSTCLLRDYGKRRTEQDSTH